MLQCNFTEAFFLAQISKLRTRVIFLVKNENMYFVYPCSTKNQFRNTHAFRDRIRIQRCWFLRRWKKRSTPRKAYRSRVENQKQTIFPWRRRFPFQKAIVIYKYSSIVPGLLEQTSILFFSFYFLSKSLLTIEGQKKLRQNCSFVLKASELRLNIDLSIVADFRFCSTIKHECTKYRMTGKLSRLFFVKFT